jgi:transposase InsO family protein
MPRQAYGIDFYGHEQGEILVAVDLCTREAILWFLANRKQDNVARALLTGLILQKGVPLSFRNDEAPEFVKGVVTAMNRYLGIEQITTGSHNPRSNAVVERFMQHLNGCLMKCDDSQYKNMKDFLPAIAFAHNTAFNSAIDCTPFEAGHGLRAKTFTEARANPRLQITAEEGTGIQEPDTTWEKSVFPKVCRLAERLAYDAHRHSQWHKRMNAHNLNKSGAKIQEKGLQQGDRVYFYRPPSQQEVMRRGRKAKHLAHYHGPATIQGKVDGRDRQYHLTYDGKSFKRDASMLVPEKEMQNLNPETHDPTIAPPSQAKPSLYDKTKPLTEEDIILCKTEKDDTSWCLAEVSRIFPDEAEVVYYTTPKPLMDGYTTATLHQRIDELLKARFRKTWYVYSGKDAGKGTLKPPFPYNPKLRLWTSKLPATEIDDLILATGMILDPQGYLSRESASIAVELKIGHDCTRTVEDEAEQLAQLRFTNYLFSYAECALCECPRCALFLSSEGKKTTNGTKKRTRPSQ